LIETVEGIALGSANTLGSKEKAEGYAAGQAPQNNFAP